MRAIVIVSHGGLAEGFKDSLEMISGDVSSVFTVSLKPSDGTEDFDKKLSELELSKYGEVWICADLLGGTPSNVSFMKYKDNPKFNIVAGINLPFLITLLLTENVEITSLIEDGKKSLINVRDISFDEEDE